MRYLLCKGSLGILILAAMTAGSGSLLAVNASPSQSAKATPHKSSTAHKKSSGTTTHSSTSTTAKKPAAASSAAKSNGSATKTSPKSAHSKTSSRKKTKKVKGQAAPTPERINEIQEALASKGVLTSTPTGKWDDSTVDAMKKFQSSHGLEPTGKLDALTLQKLGLGSQTAGLAAPTPPPNAVNRLRSQSSLPAEPPDPQSDPRN
jgi:peptidoglycan hydrolase-like protein with peptidoglycan-binding domain